ncbi:MAG TPA: histidine phosphatase family protein [Thiothrix sp.]|nr:histidine phosphatase family protein [Thiothrix sp.]
MYRGSGTDHPLSNLGWQQMQQSIDAACTGSSNWSQIITSPMTRCLTFAEQLSQQLNIPLEVINELVEAGYGEWEGKTPAQLKQEYGEAYWAFYDDPVNNRPTGAEPLEVLNERVSTTLIELLARYKGQNVLLISHAGVMRAVIGNVLQMPLASQQLINIPYAGMYSVLDERRGTRICLP